MYLKYSSLLDPWAHLRLNKMDHRKSFKKYIHHNEIVSFVFRKIEYSGKFDFHKDLIIRIGDSWTSNDPSEFKSIHQFYCSKAGGRSGGGWQKCFVVRGDQKISLCDLQELSDVEPDLQTDLVQPLNHTASPSGDLVQSSDHTANPSEEVDQLVNPLNDPDQLVEPSELSEYRPKLEFTIGVSVESDGPTSPKDLLDNKVYMTTGIIAQLKKMDLFTGCEITPDRIRIF